MRLASRIEHTNLKPDATSAQIETLCKEAIAHSFCSVCVNSCHVKKAAQQLSSSDVKVCTVIGFPLGACSTAAKVAETKAAYLDGCDEFDMVINIGALREGNYDLVREDIRAVVEAAAPRTVKVILETGLLTDAEKTIACHLVAEAGAHFVKTCTGFAVGGATVADIALMRRETPAHMQIKASGGIRTYEAAAALVAAGADRIGTSSGVAICAGEQK